MQEPETSVGLGHESRTAEGVGLSQDLCQSRPKAATSAERAPSKQSLWDQDQMTTGIAEQPTRAQGNLQEHGVTNKVTGTMALTAPQGASI